MELEEIMSKLNSEEKVFVSSLIDKDPLTGLYNRRKFDQDIELVLSMSGRANRGTGLLFIDIDNFKKYNDEYGHQKGDLILQDVTGCIEKKLRDYDKIHIYRYGGEEFVIIISDITIENTFNIGDRLRKRVKESCGITISVGISHYRDISDNLQSLINNADHALYEAKKRGRDKVVVYHKDLAPPRLKSIITTVKRSTYPIMPIRLILVSSPISLGERYGLFSGAASTEPSFGLVCLAAVAQEAGATVRIVEASSQNLSVEQTQKEILRFEPDLVGITATTAGIVAAGALAQSLKETRPGIINLIGGCHVTALPEETLLTFPGFDAAVLGEGEETLKDILCHMDKGRDALQGMAGTAVREGKKVRTNLPRPLIRNLDGLPLPAWSLLGGFPRKFRPSPSRIKRWPCASIVLTRGCPNQCVFCDRSVFGNQCRAYSPEYALGLMKDLRYHYGVKEILIEDDTFIVSSQRVRELCERIISEKMDITWSCLGRADRVNPELLSLMKKAGCWHISYGIESGDPDILRGMKKNLNIEQIKKAVHWSKEAGVYTKGFFMVGFPEESEASLSATLSLVMSLPLDDISVMQLTPFPGSQLYDTAEQYGEFERDWRKMNTLDTVFVPHGFSKRDLEATRAEILRKFYLRPSIIYRQIRRAALNPRLALSLFKGFFAFLMVTGLFSRNADKKRTE